ncbi:hypothetical protein [Pleionea sp. CnH1-48]|uniref:hypothetical protein n=1 Tax=Pleionea sp. CnH1-48 TaxID=2954494 RepID=UPI0020978129|nr:hypothetical protein [Pleionea sp. CnH1-48]MCO7226356.1 hypothetical protein [Pleionea sp. CnH1-48]
MSDFMKNTFLSITPSDMTELFMLIMLVVFIIAVLAHATNRLKLFVHQAPGLLTSLGILGTFTGVIIGLMSFDITQIEAGISQLLDGLKTAFITSVMGITLSILFKIIITLFPRTHPDNELGIQHLYQAINQQTSVIEQLSQRINSQQQNQRETLKHFTEDLSQQTAQSLVKELSLVVTEFNQKLSNQFGEHFTLFGDRFEQFGLIVDSLSNEFEAHEARINHWLKSNEAHHEAVNKTHLELEKIGEKLALIPAHLETLNPVLEQGKEQISLINEQLKAYQSTYEQVTHIVPEVSKNLSEFTDGIHSVKQLLTHDLQETMGQYNQTLQQAQQGVLAPIEEWQQNLKQLEQHQRNTIDEWKQQLSTAVGELNQCYIQSLTALSDQSAVMTEQTGLIQDVLSQIVDVDTTLVDKIVEQTLVAHRQSFADIKTYQQESYQQISDALRSYIEESLHQSDTSFAQQQNLINHKLEQEISQVMEAMGEALALISGQFARDYQQLLMQMKRIMKDTQELSL